MSPDAVIYKGWELLFTGWKGVLDGDAIKPPYVTQWFGKPIGATRPPESAPYASYPGGQGMYSPRGGKFDIAPRDGQVEIINPDSPEAEAAKTDALQRACAVIG